LYVFSKASNGVVIRASLHKEPHDFIAQAFFSKSRRPHFIEIAIEVKFEQLRGMIQRSSVVSFEFKSIRQGLNYHKSINETLGCLSYAMVSSSEATKKNCWLLSSLVMCFIIRMWFKSDSRDIPLKSTLFQLDKQVFKKKIWVKINV
jgi:hypothetical protein